MCELYNKQHFSIFKRQNTIFHFSICNYNKENGRDEVILS